MTKLSKYIFVFENGRTKVIYTNFYAEHLHTYIHLHIFQIINLHTKIQRDMTSWLKDNKTCIVISRMAPLQPAIYYPQMLHIRRVLLARILTSDINIYTYTYIYMYMRGIIKCPCCFSAALAGIKQVSIYAWFFFFKKR